MYSLIRLVLLVIILAVLLVFLYKQKIKITKPKMIIIIICTIILYVILKAIPIENTFLRFNTIEDSFSYYYPNNNIMQIVEEKDCAFIISGKSQNSTTLHTVTKYGEQWGLIDVNSQSALYLSDIKSPSNKMVLLGATIYNKDKKKTFVNINASFPYDNNWKIPIEDENGVEYTIYNFKRENNIISANYYIVEPYPVLSDFSVYIKDKEIIIKKSPLSIF